MNYDFASLVDQKEAEDEAEEQAKKERKRKKKEGKTASSESQRSTSTTTTTTTEVPASSTSTTTTRSQKPVGTTTQKTPDERLLELKQLKEKGLITPQEYEAKRKEILNQL